MVNLAFIISLVASAVFLIVGISIFSEIVEAMALTLPLPTILPVLPANITDEWQLREQEKDVNFVVGCDPNINGTKIELEFLPPNEVGWCHMFKVFDKSDVIGKTLEIDWQGSSGGFAGQSASVRVFDGSINRNNATQFPLDGVGAVTRGFHFNIGELNNLHIITHSMQFGDILQVGTTDTIIMTLAGSTKNKVTIGVSLLDKGSSEFHVLNIEEIRITELATWEWGLNTPLTSTVTMNSTTTQNDAGITNSVNLKNTQPLVLSSESQREHDTFNNAQLIGFTVIGVLPIALFFALFTILSGRME